MWHIDFYFSLLHFIAAKGFELKEGKEENPSTKFPGLLNKTSVCFLICVSPNIVYCTFDVLALKL